MKKIIIFSMFIFLFSQSIIYADDSTTTPTWDKNTSSLQAQVNEFYGINLSSNYQDLKHKLALTIYDSLKSFQVHSLAYDKNSWLLLWNQNNLKDKYKTYRDNFTNYNNQAFDETKILSDNSAKDTRKTDKKSITQLRKLTSSKVIINNNIPITWKLPDATTGFLSDAYLGTNAQVTMEKNKIDMMLWGFVGNIGTTIYYTLYFQEVWMKKPLIIKANSDINSLYINLKKNLRQIKQEILGRPFASLLVHVFPPDSLVYINDQLASVGTLNNFYAPTGVLKISVRRPSFFSDTFYVNLKNKEVKKYTIRLNERYEKPSFFVTSYPLGADVYLNNSWMGKTPLPLLDPSQKSLLQLRLPGYQTTSKVINPSLNTDLNIKLKSTLEPIEFEKAKIRFYTSVTFFGISLATFTILNAFRANLQTYMANTQDETVFNQAYPYYNAFFISSYVALGALGAFGTWMLLDLFLDYLPKAQLQARE